MSYATLADLIERAGQAEILQIADRDRDGTPDPAVIAAALKDADNLVNGYIGVKYALPLPAVPDLVCTWSVKIARYFLHHNGAPEHVADDYREAVAALKDVARGLAALPVAPGATPPAQAEGQVMAEHPPQVFTRKKLRGWS